MDKIEKVDLSALRKSSRRKTERRLISRFITDPKEKKKWKSLFKSRKKSVLQHSKKI